MGSNSKGLLSSCCCATLCTLLRVLEQQSITLCFTRVGEQPKAIISQDFLCLHIFQLSSFKKVMVRGVRTGLWSTKHSQVSSRTQWTVFQLEPGGWLGQSPTSVPFTSPFNLLSKTLSLPLKFPHSPKAGP